jgi:hypothetical protein
MYITHLPHPFKKSGIKIPVRKEVEDIAVFLL